MSTVASDRGRDHVARPALSPADVYGAGLEAGIAAGLLVRFPDGRSEPADLGRWLGPVDAADESVITRLTGPVLDVGCGPGRHVLACERSGIAALGVDISPAAIAEARRRGAPAIEGCVFSGVPRAGHWCSALLLDGNIGIGGDPVSLLMRLAELLAPSGRVIAEVREPGSGSGVELVRLEIGGWRSTWFPWARVDLAGIHAHAAAAALTVRETWEAERRWFVRLERAR